MEHIAVHRHTRDNKPALNGHGGHPPGVAPGRLVTEYCPHENPELSSEESESYSAAPRAAPELAGVRTGVVMSRLETLSSKRPVASKRRGRDVAVGRGVGAATGLAGDSHGRY